ncbi:hypothetical protein AVEN_103652-1 [Araneus ventricosus]|uniref:Uncharacterized protein n=1 Tax=Araneus ventricosus TaxID=182803 RepID=A0A4Y2NQ03_ARAVE|nr:hypothetical protein AVEN_103652-1 [Araneus ventricosus]
MVKMIMEGGKCSYLRRFVVAFLYSLFNNTLDPAKDLARERETDGVSSLSHNFYLEEISIMHVTGKTLEETTGKKSFTIVTKLESRFPEMLILATNLATNLGTILATWWKSWRLWRQKEFSRRTSNFQPISTGFMNFLEIASLPT